MVRNASHQEEWIGTEIGLSWYTLKFRDRHDELGYSKYCAPRLNRNLFIAVCLEMFIIIGTLWRVLADNVGSLAEPTWLVRFRVWFLATLFVSTVCYIVVYFVPRLNNRMGSFARESYCVAMGIVTIVYAASSGKFYISLLLQTSLDDADFIRSSNNQNHMLMTILWLSGTHLMVPVRWYVLVPLELVSMFWWPLWEVFSHSWNQGSFSIGNHSGWYGMVPWCVMSIFFALGKRHTECAERYLFKKYLSEKSLRVITEFKLSSQLASKKGAPSEVSSQAIFANLGLNGQLKEKVDNIVALGRKERWVLDSGVTIEHDRVIGTGGFGKVCLAHLHGTPAVVKMPLAPMCEWIGIGASHLHALSNEIRLLRRLRHPNIVLFHGAIFIDHNTCFGLVLEFVDGVSLNSCVTSLSEAFCLKLCLDLSRALQYFARPGSTYHSRRFEAKQFDDP